MVAVARVTWHRGYSETVEDWSWQDRALCKGEKTSAWFPGYAGESYTAAAKRFCAACPVRRPCLEFALVHDEFGVWGGLTEGERRRLRKQRRRAA